MQAVSDFFHCFRRAIKKAGKLWLPDLCGYLKEGYVLSAAAGNSAQTEEAGTEEEHGAGFGNR